MTYDEIYDFALNEMSKKINFIYLLDGGGSTSYVLNNQLINQPTSIKNGKAVVEERRILNILMVK